MKTFLLQVPAIGSYSIRLVFSGQNRQTLTCMISLLNVVYLNITKHEIKIITYDHCLFHSHIFRGKAQEF